MAKAIPSTDAAERVERLKALLAYLRETRGLKPAGIARTMKIHKSGISNAKTRGVSPQLQIDFQKHYGVVTEYWTSARRRSPEECVRGPAQDLAKDVSVVVLRDRIQQLARERHESDSVLAQLVRIKPPEGSEKDPWWYFGEYLRISDEARRGDAPPASAPTKHRKAG